jgi:hypothetical protein
MTTPREHGDEDEWSPATSAPGEIFTPEGQIKQAGAFARGLTNKDPRAKAYRHQMMMPGLVIIGLAFAFVAVVIIVNALR